MHHLEVLKSLSSDQRKQLTQKSDLVGLIHCFAHFAAIALLIAAIIVEAPHWYWLMLPLGILQVFLFTLLHETCHKTVFKSVWLNKIIAQITGFILFLPATWFKDFHFEHHRFTQIPGKDPELAESKPETWPQFLKHVSGLPVWLYHLQTLIRNAKNPVEDFVPEPAHKGVRIEARAWLLIYLLLMVASIVYGSIVLLKVWIIPLLLGQPFLRLYLIAEHGLCENSDNALDNSRTTKTNWLIRKLAWNMPYHVEHHTYPGVPFYRLPELHKIVQPHAQVIENGYLSFYRKYFQHLNNKAEVGRT